MKIAFVVQRYGTEIIGGAEYFTRLVAEHLQGYHSIEILTTCAKGYHTWENEYPEGNEEINRVIVRRFKNSQSRTMSSQMKIQEKVFYQHHTIADEDLWIREQGPYCPGLVDFIREHRSQYDLFVFFTYRYYQSYYGIEEALDKSIIVPFAENDPALKLKKTSVLFSKSKGIIFSTSEEKNLIEQCTGVNFDDKLWDTIGCGIEIPSPDCMHSSPGQNNYILYLGRIEGSKGCYQLFEFYLRYLSLSDNAPDLVLAGSDAIGIPNNKKIRYLGVVSEERKIQLLKGAKVLIMPSLYESFSLVTLESMASGTPVLANGECEVLKLHCIRSNAGLWYQNFEEFQECLTLLLSSENITGAMGKNGIRYVKNNYSWDIVTRRYLDFFEMMRKIVPIDPVPGYKMT